MLVVVVAVSVYKKIATPSSASASELRETLPALLTNSGAV